MKNIKIKLVAVLWMSIVTYSNCIMAQDTSMNVKDTTRVLFFSAGIGYNSILNIKLGCQLSDNLSIAVVRSAYFTEYGAPIHLFEDTIGLNVAVYFKPFTFLKFNSLELQCGFKSYMFFDTYSTDILLTRENIMSEKISFYYSLGVSGIWHTEPTALVTASKFRFNPSVRVGINFNL